MKRNRNLAALVGFLLAAASLHALNPAEWKHRQPFTVESAGPLKFSLPAETIGSAQSDLRDLRLLGPDSRDVPFLLVRPAAEIGRDLAAKNFRVELSGDFTVITLETGTNDLLDSIELTTGAMHFLKAARLEISADGQSWETLAEGAPIFRQDGAVRTRLSLERRTAAFIRLTLDDQRSRPVVITGATLRTATHKPAPTEPLTPRLVSTEEFAGETVLTLDLGAPHLLVSSLEIVADDPLFTRPIIVAVRELQDGEIVERTLARGTIFRIALDGLAPTADLNVAVANQAPSRELIVHIENGDSPPLRISEIRAHRSPVYVIAAPTGTGRHELLTGNPQAAAPRYDLAALSVELNRLPLSSPSFGPLAVNPDYRQADPLAGLTLEGAPIDTSAWQHRRPVVLSAPGVQQIELDLAVLAAAQNNFADLRLVQNGQQVPYIVERTRLTRDLPLIPESVPDTERPAMSRWKFALPKNGLSLTRLTLNSPTSLFDRRIHVYETPLNYRGESYVQTLASVSWTRTPGSPAKPLAVTLNTRLATDTLWVETDNGDNPPLALERAQVFYPVTRLLAKIGGDEPVSLIYGNASASAPRYDVGLVAAQLLVAERQSAGLGAEEKLERRGGLSFLKGARGGAFFWAVLAVVVVLLLIVVAKLLPSNPPKA